MSRLTSPAARVIKLGSSVPPELALFNHLGLLLPRASFTKSLYLPREVLGTSGMIATDNVYPNTAKIYKNDFTGNADMPFDFFLSRYFEAYVRETEAFCKSLVEDSPVPCTGIDGLIALVMSLAADKSAEVGRWVKFSEVIEQVYCSSPTECLLLVDSDVFPDGFKPTKSIKELDNLVVPDVDQQKKGGTFMDKFKEMVWS